jgi:hypothetical protein
MHRVARLLAGLLGERRGEERHGMVADEPKNAAHTYEWRCDWSGCLQVRSLN